MIRLVTPADAECLSEIYNHYILHSTYTFESESLSVEEMWQRAETTISQGYPYWVYEIGGQVEGYACLRPWREGRAYETTAEVSLYVGRRTRGIGVGRKLLAHLLSVVDKERFHLLVSCISLSNDPSVRLFEQHGFVKVSQMNEVAKKFGVWCGVGHWVLYPNKAELLKPSSCACGAHDACRCD